MTKKIIITVLFGLGLFLTGCATTSAPSYVGIWECLDIPQEMQKNGITGLDVYIADTGDFSLAAKGSANGALGTWKKNNDGKIDITIPNKDGGTGTLLDADTLVISANGLSMTFKRK